MPAAPASNDSQSMAVEKACRHVVDARGCQRSQARQKSTQAAEAYSPATFVMICFGAQVVEMLHLLYFLKGTLHSCVKTC
jgi:2-methylcitrate dehydratase PrpD